MSKSVDLSVDYKVTESNTLIEAHYRLSLMEQKFILIMASLVEPEDENFKFYDVKINDLLDILKVDDDKKWGTIYDRVHDLFKNLSKKPLVIFEEKQYVSINWISSLIVYTDKSPKKGIVSFEFSERLKPYLLQLKREFASYRLKNVMNLKSTHAIRIYRLLKQYENIGKRRIDYLELKKILGIEDKYKIFWDFKKWVLEPAQREIETTDIRFDYEAIRKGRSVVAIEFRIFPMTEIKPLLEVVTEPTTVEPEVITLLISKGKLSPKEAGEIWEKKFDFVDPESRKYINEAELSFEQYLREKLFLVEKETAAGKINNIQGFTYNAILKNYTSSAFAEEEARREKQKKKDALNQLKRETERLTCERDEAVGALTAKILVSEEDLLETVIGELLADKESGLGTFYKVGKTPTENYQNPLIRGIIDNRVRVKFADQFNEIEKTFAVETARLEKQREKLKKK